MRIKISFKIATESWNAALRYFRKNPSILIPFVIAGLFDCLLLALIYLAPRPPLSVVLAPPIRAFWGEKFLHYPYNFLIIPRLYSYGHIFSSATISVLMTATAIGMLKEASSGIKPGISVNLRRSIKRYAGLFGIWLAAFILMGAASKITRLIGLKGWPVAAAIASAVSFILAVFVEVLFVYAIPAMIIKKEKIFRAVKTGLRFSGANFLPTLILVIVPALIYLPMMALKTKMPFLISKTFPETILIFLGAGIFTSTVINVLIVCSTAALFLKEGKTS